MAIRNVLRLMEEKDLLDVPEARKEFEEHGHYGSYFFFVIEDDNKEVIGYLIAKKENEKVVITKFDLPKVFEKKLEYQNTAISNLYDYVKRIKGTEGKNCFTQVSFS